MARVQLTLAAALGVVAVVLAVILVLGNGDGTGRKQAFTVSPQGFAGAISPANARATDFRLTDENGKPSTLAAERGKVTVLTFLYTTCQDTCPIAASQILGALDDLGAQGRSVAAIAVSVDPAHDTPALARKFLLGRRLTGRMHFALGSAPQLSPVWKAYGVQPQGPGAATNPAFDHTARVVVIDRRGDMRVAFPLDQLTPDALAHDLRKLLAEPNAS